MDHPAFPVVFLVATRFVAAIQSRRNGMNNKLLNCLVAGVLGTTLALASPALARGGGGGGGGGGGMHGGGGMAGGGMGGGMHAGGMGGGMGGGMHAGAMGGGTHFGGMSGGTHFSGNSFAAAPFAHRGFSPRSSRFAFRDRDHFGRRFHHRFNRFAFVGGDFAYGYDSCWRRTWTPYGLQWVDVCGGYGY
jgi:hypothetical protein